METGVSVWSVGIVRVLVWSVGIVLGWLVLYVAAKPSATLKDLIGVFVLVAVFLMFLGLGGCASVLQDPPMNLQQVTTPDSVLKAAPASAKVDPPPVDVSTARRVGWVPRYITKAGDIIEGHEVTLTLTPRTQEVLKPSMVIPHAPRVPQIPTAPKVRYPAAAPSSTVPSDDVPPVHPLLHGQQNPLVP